MIKLSVFDNEKIFHNEEEVISDSDHKYQNYVQLRLLSHPSSFAI